MIIKTINTHPSVIITIWFYDNIITYAFLENFVKKNRGLYRHTFYVENTKKY